MTRNVTQCHTLSHMSRTLDLDKLNYLLFERPKFLSHRVKVNIWRNIKQGNLTHVRWGARRQFHAPLKLSITAYFFLMVSPRDLGAQSTFLSRQSRVSRKFHNGLN